VVADQRGKPTSADELARLTLALLPQAEGRWGTYHVAQPDATSWHGFAEAVFAEARRQGVALKVSSVKPIAASEYPTPARRPANSELNCERVVSAFAVTIRPWRDSLVRVIEELRDA
jgi:dTDP-4-dehydrorhamnose reductase